MSWKESQTSMLKSSIGNLTSSGFWVKFETLGKAGQGKGFKTPIFVVGMGVGMVCTCLRWDLWVDPWLPIPSKRLGGLQIFVESRP